MRNAFRSNISFEKLKTRTNRKGTILKLMKVRTLSGRKCMKYSAARMYNDLPEDIKSLKPISSFKWSVKCHIRSESFIQKSLSSKYLEDYACDKHVETFKL
jgi:hypothetical protein